MSQSLDLWSMKCFIILAEELHFGRAATRLNMTQPTLSQQIRKLESIFGVQLFIRSTRSVELTPSGATFLPLAREALIKLEEAVLLSKLAAGGMSPGGEQLKIGAIGPAAHRLLPLILRRFRNRFPKTRLDVRIFDSSEILRALERGEYDIGIMRPPTNANFIRFRPLMSDRFVAVIPKNSPLARRPSLRLSDFIGQDVFTLKRFELSSFRAIHDQIIEAGIEADTSFKVSSTTAALAMASAGLGITFLPEWIESIVDSEVVLRRVEDLTEEISTGIAWRADNPIPGILPFVEFAELISRRL
ncbi:DNA-binding transcriptional LysR family regulator [Rhizobium petrolearium]|uniref:LysR family transcriptional regulator n=1 Tax=Neorhizobium petrolearium TaxID=515361 RepID=UPI001AE60670|nr:LysR family transcriptional regulator [Neorhizobium petrolearium]MBP1848105.1 DNA-binding transcriptional LysR family regulator [Neorhizobium petrolearium]